VTSQLCLSDPAAQRALPFRRSNATNYRPLPQSIIHTIPKNSIIVSNSPPSWQKCAYNENMLSDIALEQIRNPRYAGPIEDATHFGTCGCRGDGPYCEIWLTIEDGIILKAAYRTHGCPSSVAAASMLCHLATGRTVEQALSITDRDLLLVLGGLPDGKEQLATTAVAGLSSAVSAANRGDVADWAEGVA